MFRTRHTSIALVALLGVAIVASASAWAAATVTSRTIKDNTIQSRDIKNGQVRTVDISAAARYAFTAEAVQPHVEVNVSGTPQSIASISNTPIEFDTEVEDVFGMFSVADPSKIYAPTSGLYLVAASVYWAPAISGATSMEMYIDTNNSSSTQRGFMSGTNGSSIISGTSMVRLEAGQWVRILARHDAPGAVSVNTYYTSVTMTRIGK